jgi:hypothetical protein
MADSSTLAQIASIIAAFSVAMLFFRVPRELEMRKRGKEVWIPFSDQLLIYATLLSLFLVILPIIMTREATPFVVNLTRASCAAAVIMLGGYIPGILAHYRLIWGRHLEAPRQNPEPTEKVIVLASILIAFVAFVIIMLGIPSAL